MRSLLNPYGVLMSCLFGCYDYTAVESAHIHQARTQSSKEGGSFEAFR